MGATGSPLSSEATVLPHKNNLVEYALIDEASTQASGTFKILIVIIVIALFYILALKTLEVYADFLPFFREKEKIYKKNSITESWMFC